MQRGPRRRECSIRPGARRRGAARRRLIELGLAGRPAYRFADGRLAVSLCGCTRLIVAPDGAISFRIARRELAVPR